MKQSWTDGSLLDFSKIDKITNHDIRKLETVNRKSKSLLLQYMYKIKISNVYEKYV